MRNLLLTVGIILVFAWAVAFFAFSVGAIIHFLLVFAIISFIVGFIPRGKALRFK